MMDKDLANRSGCVFMRWTVIEWLMRKRRRCRKEGCGLLNNKYKINGDRVVCMCGEHFPQLIPCLKNQNISLFYMINSKYWLYSPLW